MVEAKKDVNRSRRWRMILTLFTLGALFFLVYVSRKQILETFSNFERVNLYILLFIIVWQILNYHTYARLYQRLFAILGVDITYKQMYKAAIELNFVNNVFPSAGVSGFSYFGYRMKQMGATAGQATLVQTMRFITVFISFQAILLIGVLLLAVNGKASNLAIAVASSLGTLLVMGTLIVVYIVGDRNRINTFFTTLTKFLNGLIRLVRPKHPETIRISAVRKLFIEFHENYEILKKNYTKLKMPLVYAFFASLTEICTIYTVYVAFGDFVNFGAVIIAYAVANFAGLISVLPGGIGVFEGLMTGVLAAVGVPPSTSIPATIMYRILSMAIQLPPGYYLYHKAVNRKGRHRA